jgi:23S rRNA (cytidine1920-2'-O)/16S rRNA (cytidine1409-2'-O)-methyltransferase
VTRERIDKLLVEKGLAETRTRAQAMIMAGLVLVDEKRIEKPGQLVDRSAPIRIKGETLRYVSRGGLKLEEAIRAFGIDPTGKICIDIGASTGGFTDCLLQHGAAKVWAVDVGHNQLAWQIRKDPRVTVLEGINARNLEPGLFPVRFSLAVIDVSFISLSKIFPAVARIVGDGADIIALIKPQFEVGKGEVGKGGVVTDPLKHKRVIEQTVESALESGLVPIDLTESPILGAEGNREFFIHLSSSKSLEQPEFIRNRIDVLTERG